MKVLQLIQRKQLRGAEIFACQLSEELIKRDVTVDVLYLFSHEGAGLDFKLNFIPLNANIRKRLWDLAAYKRLARIIRRGKYDIVQANAGDTLKYAVLSRFLFGWKGKLIFRNANKMGDFIRNVYQRKFNQWLLSKCDFFISVSENSRNDLINLYPRARSLSRTIPIGTYLFETTPATGQVSLAEPVLVNVGSFVPEKNHSFLLDVFNLYFKRTRKGYLWLVGDGKLRPAIEEKIASLGISDRVKLWGYQKEVVSILKASDVFVMCSKIEGLPAVVLEAIACDVPVVTSRVGGIGEVIEHDVTGICIADWAPEQYVEEIAKVLADMNYRYRLVRKAKSVLKEKYLLESISASFIIEYRRLLNVPASSVA